jgi:WD40 repeat protein
LEIRTSEGFFSQICFDKYVSSFQTGLVTSSLDGKLNFWSFSNLREPLESLQVGDSTASVAVAPESQSILLGDEHGGMYVVQYASSTSSTSDNASGSSGISTRTSTRKQVRKLETTSFGETRDTPIEPNAVETINGESTAPSVEGHYGMVTSIATKVVKRGVVSAAGHSKGFLRGSGGLVLTTGVDWTVKLWAPAYRDTPLLSWVSHSYDYMSDVQWCPTHASLFATASSNGTVGLWNLATSMEDPLTGSEGIVVEPNAASGRGLNKLRWSADGRRIATSASDRLHVITWNDDILRPKGDEEATVMNQLMTRDLVSHK